MLIKVCGIKYQDNLDMISQLDIDMIGLNFYAQSSRYVEESIKLNGSKIALVGVFVNESIEKIVDISKNYKLSYAQLHGDESPEFCNQLANQINVIKAFSIQNPEDFEKTNPYKGCKYFIFDTKTPGFGGSGNKFDWEMLDLYCGYTPFLLAGGISPDDTDAILDIDHDMLTGIDVNSKFEIRPGEKDIEALELFCNKIKIE